MFVAAVLRNANLPHDRAAIYHDHLAGDIFRPVACEKERRTDEILRLADAAQRDLLGFGVKFFFTFDVGFGLWRVDRAWADAVDRDTIRRELKRQGFCEGNNSTLGSGIVRSVCRTRKRTP